MKKLVLALLNRRRYVLMSLVGVLVLGVWSGLRLPIDAVPDITNVQVMVNTKTGALAPEEIERSVTLPIETELLGMPDVEDVRSISKYGLSQVTVIFRDGTNLYWARQLVSERLQNVRGELPEGMTPVMGPVATGLGEVLMYVVVPKEGTPLSNKKEEERLRYLRGVQDLRIRPILRTSIGVAEVDSTGGYRRIIEVSLDPNAMSMNGVSMDRLTESLNNAGSNTGGAYVETSKERSIVRILGRFDSLEQIRRLPIRMYAVEPPVPLSDIALVHEGNDLRVGAATYEGSEAVLGTVMMRIGENSRVVAAQAAAKLREIDLPSDVEVKIVYSRDKLVNATIATVGKNLAEAAVLVIGILLLILGNVRGALIVALAIPVSALAAVTGMLGAGISANLMSLGAMDFGLLVDGSVVLIENYLRRLEERTDPPRSSAERFELIAESAREVGPPVISGLLIIMIVYVPVMSLTGVEGKLFKPMAATVLFALFASLITAICVMPVLIYYGLRPARAMKVSRTISRFKGTYEVVLQMSIRRRGLLLTFAIAVLVLATIAFTRKGFDFMPALDEGDAVINVSRDAKVSLATSVKEQLEIEKAAKTFPEIETVFSRIGTSDSGTDPMGIHYADTFIILRPKEKVPAGTPRRTKAELLKAINEEAGRRVEGNEFAVSQPIEMRFNEMLEGSRADVSFRIFGPDLKTLMELTEKAQKVFEGIEGVEEVGVDELSALRTSPTFDYKLRHERLSGFGMHAHDVNTAFETAMAGRTIGFYYDNVFRIPIVIRLAERFRNDIQSVGRIPVEVPGGGLLPLQAFADLQKSDQVTTISHMNSRRYSSVAVYLGSRDLSSFVKEAKAQIKAKVPMPEGFTSEWAGQFTNLEKAQSRLAFIAPISLLLVLLILARAFSSFPQALLVFVCIPFAATGGIFSLFLRGIPLSVSSTIGFIALAGIAVLNGTVMVSHFNQLRKEGGLDLTAAVLQGSLDRIRPVILTALVASLGFLPMALNTGTGAEVQRPLATVVIGGLVSSTILTLLLLPSLYEWLERRRGG